MLFKLRRAIKVGRYNRQVAAILETPPLKISPEGNYTLLSQVCHLDVTMWVVAAKSWARYKAPSKVVLLDDGTLTTKDRVLIEEQVPGATIVTFDDVPNDHCPKHVCFERLLLIADLVPDEFVLQLDSDTVTMSEPSEAIESIDRNACFTLGTNVVPDVMPLLEAQRICADHSWTPREFEHAQVQSEIAFEHLSNPEQRRYVRANAAFAGFAKGSITRDSVESFSKEMEALLPDRWSAWGTEQVASNYLIANQDGAQIYHDPRYVWHAPENDISEASWVHFIGSYRFDNGTYARLSRQVAQEMIDQRN